MRPTALTPMREYYSRRAWRSAASGAPKVKNASPYTTFLSRDGEAPNH